jgi:micrococcal nuclease
MITSRLDRHGTAQTQSPACSHSPNRKAYSLGKNTKSGQVRCNSERHGSVRLALSLGIHRKLFNRTITIITSTKEADKMHKGARWLVLLTLMLGVYFASNTSSTFVFAQVPTSISRTFTETGKIVSGKFLQYWLIHGGLAQQGLPISHEMSEVSQTDGKTYTVQYFERAVFEYHPELQPPNDVLLSLLGVFRYQQKYQSNAPNQVPNNEAGSVAFPETGKRVGGKFLTYWRSHGGLPQQGLPVSEEFVETSDLNGQQYRVQYFERAVFEFHPENPPPNDVLLSQLGTFRYRGVYEGLNARTIQPATVPVPSAGWEEARVVRVIDGDTIEVTVGGQSKTVRYIGVNTPETVAPNRPVECFGPEASNANKAMVSGKSVWLEKDVSETDRFGRLLRYVFANDGFVNAELVKQGYAQVSTFPPDVKYVPLFQDLQNEARSASRGLWGPVCQARTTPTRPPVAPTATRVPVPPPPPPPPPSGTGKVIISSVFYDGAEPRTEGDEYAVLSNTGSTPVNLQGYRLNAGDLGQDFTFPPFVLQAGAQVRVYTNRNIAGSFSFGRGQAIWNNDGDCGYLFDPGGNQVSEYCY